MRTTFERGELECSDTVLTLYCIYSQKDIFSSGPFYHSPSPNRLPTPDPEGKTTKMRKESWKDKKTEVISSYSSSLKLSLFMRGPSWKKIFFRYSLSIPLLWAAVTAGLR